MPPRDPRKTYIWVSTRLRERVEAGEWLPGEKLPDLRTIAEEYGVSLATAARAAQVLDEAGLVQVIPHYGVFRK
jgi:DNA-binding GntR family transcriptional regulator